jgi:hypothetical protein
MKKFNKHLDTCNPLNKQKNTMKKDYNNSLVDGIRPISKNISF